VPVNRASERETGTWLRTAAGLLVLIAGFALFRVEPVHGPVLMSLGNTHGLDLGDFVCLPVIVLGFWLLRDGPVHRRVLGALRAAERAGWDPATIGLLLAGAGLVLVWVFLEVDAGSRIDHAGVLPATIAALGLVLLGCALSEPGASRAIFGASLVVVLGTLGVGFLIDATDGPAGSIVGPTMLAALLAVTLGRRRIIAAVVFGVTTVVFLLADLAALVDAGRFRDDRRLDGGGLGRTAALGGVLVLVGLLRVSDRVRNRARARPPAVG
jgi:hypothetical protein